jgi:hypothetical protein
VTRTFAESHGSAEAGATLGARTKAPWRVRVSLVKEDGVWRIRRVAKDRERSPTGAAMRALSDC